MDSFEKQWQKWFPEDQDNKPGGVSGRSRFSKILWAIGALIGLFIIISIFKGFYTDWLWFSSLGYGSVFTTILWSRILIFFIAAIIFSLLFIGNMFLASRLVPKTDNSLLPWALVKRLQPTIRTGVILLTLFLSLIFGLIAQSNWELILRSLNWQPFGMLDPVFQKEVGFYMFSLPFLNLLRSWLTGVFIVCLIGSIGVYAVSYGIQRLKFNFARSVMIHIGGLFIIILGFFAWGYWLGIWDLVYSSRGVVFGASYADMHSKLPAQWILLAVVILFIIIVIFSIARRNYRLILYGIGG